MVRSAGAGLRTARARRPHPGRVVVQQRNGYLVATDEGEVRAKLSGRLRHEAREAGHPAVGDWVALSPNLAERTATIHAILPRRTAFVRRAADSLQTPQVVAANIDLAFVVTSMNADLNPRRIERYLAAAWQSGARPVVVLTKSDLCVEPQLQAAEIEALASRLSGCRGVGAARPGSRRLVGPFGAGRDLRADRLVRRRKVHPGQRAPGEQRMATQAIREADDQGRHTTSHRQLVLLPGGGLIVDTPGVREVGLIDADEGLSMVFDDIERWPKPAGSMTAATPMNPAARCAARYRAGRSTPTAGRTSRSLGLNWPRWRRRRTARQGRRAPPPGRASEGLPRHEEGPPRR
jgi:ribosome biogenesis GTPase